MAAVARPALSVLCLRTLPKIFGIITIMMICVCSHMIEWVQRDVPPASVVIVANATNSDFCPAIVTIAARLGTQHVAE